MERIEKTQSIDPYFVDTAVDFIRVYADRTHHGKEEDIMFNELRGKELSNEDRQLMNELIEDDIFFPSVRFYFSEEEDQAMLAGFWEFDRKMIHEKYKAVVKDLEAK